MTRACDAKLWGAQESAVYVMRTRGRWWSLPPGRRDGQAGRGDGGQATATAAGPAHGRGHDGGAGGEHGPGDGGGAARWLPGGGGGGLSGGESGVGDDRRPVNDCPVNDAAGPGRSPA